MNRGPIEAGWKTYDLSFHPGIFPRSMNRGPIEAYASDGRPRRE